MAQCFHWRIRVIPNGCTRDVFNYCSFGNNAAARGFVSGVNFAWCLLKSGNGVCDYGVSFGFYQALKFTKMTPIPFGNNAFCKTRGSI